MPAVTCPLAGCGYSTDDTEPVLAAAQLNLHAISHTHATLPAGAAVKQRPPKIDRPIIRKETSEEDWNTFIKKWDLFKRGTDIPNTQLTTHLWQCCDPELETELFKDVPDISTATETLLLASIKQLAVISIAASVRRADFLSLRQDHGQPIRSFAAKVKGKAQTCAFNKNCTRAGCTQVVDYTDEMVKYVIISGIADEDIKKEVLGAPDLDAKSLNDTITIIENKEMAARAIAMPDRHHQTNAINSDISKDVQLKLAQKSKCKQCHKTIQRYKLRNKGPNKVLKEFQLCVDCWRKDRWPENGEPQGKPTTGAIFDVIKAVHVTPSKPSSIVSTISSKNNPQLIDHHIFDGTYGWMIAESKPQPTIQLRIFTNKSDHDHLNLPYHQVKSTRVNAITDTGAQSSLMGLKTFLKCGFHKRDMVPVKQKMYAANNEGIKILGAIFARLSGADRQGSRVETAEMVYITDSTELFYLSRRAMENLQIISPDFPSIGASARSAVNSATNHQGGVTPPCDCLRRQPPPVRPTTLPFKATEENTEKMKQWLLDRFASSTFNKCTHQPLPMMSGPPIRIHIDPGAPPIAVHTPAPIPIHWREAVKQQLDEDVRLGVIEKVGPNTPSTWCHRAIWIRKADGGPRRVVDFQSLNKHCLRDTHHTVPPFQQARMIPPGTYRSVTDAWNGYHSVPVAEGDRHLLTFITEFGRYRYRVAPQGYLASGDGYTHRYDRIIADVPRKTKCVDDTTLWDEPLEEHWWRMLDYLELMGKEGIVLNRTKFQFSQKDIKFAGFYITAQDVRPLDKYLDSIKQFPTPKRIADVRAWFGLVNQVSHYGKLTDEMLPFKPLLSPKTPFKWTEELQEAFENSKVQIVKAIEEGVRIFDPQRKTCLSPDWSRTGIGYWLWQQYCGCASDTPNCCEGGWKITLAGSRFLRPSEQRYAPIEGEALAIAWALEDTKFFTIGCDKLIIATDHKPLTKIFSDRSLDDITNTRIFRLKQRTLMWRFNVIHIPGKLIPASDATSRNPAASSKNCQEWTNENLEHVGICSTTDHLEGEIIAATKASLNKIQAVTWERVKSETQVDPYLCQLKELIINGFPREMSLLPPQLQIYWQYREKLSIIDQVIMYDDRIVIPPVLRPEICNNLHSAHQGTTGMSERAKATVFWPGISLCIQRTRDCCDTCWKIAPSQSNLPPIAPIVPTSPFEAIASDYFHLHGYSYLVTVDRFSNWPHITKVEHNATTAGAKGLIRALKRSFATFGVPYELSSDGGPEFVARETTDFIRRWGVQHRLSSAYHPRSNGRAEVAVKAMKRLLRDNVSSDGEIDSESFTRAILQFRNTPDPTSKLSPAEIVFGRTIRDVLPVKPPMQIFDCASVKPSWRHLWRRREGALQTRSVKQMETLSCKSRQIDPLALGDTCRVQNQTGQFPTRWDKTGTVVQTSDNNQYVIKVFGSNRLTLRNRKYLRRVGPVSVVDIPVRHSATPPAPAGTTTASPPPSIPTATISPDTLTTPDEPTSSAPSPNQLLAEENSTPIDTGVENNGDVQEPVIDPAASSQTHSHTPPTRPRRERRPPGWQKDYEMNN